MSELAQAETIAMMSCGQVVKDNDIERLALAPLPVTNNRQPISVTKFVAINKKKLLEIRRVNANIGAAKLMLFGGIFLLGSIIFVWFMMSKMLLFFLPIPLFFSVFLGGTLYFDQKDGRDSVRRNVPTVFHPQRQEVLIYRAGNKLERPSLFSSMNSDGFKKGASDRVILAAFSGAIIFSLGWARCVGHILDSEYGEGLPLTISLILIGLFCLYIPLKPWFTYFRQLKKQPRQTEQQQFIGVPWEQVAVELHHLSAVSYIGLRTMYTLNFMCPLPGETDKKYLISLPVYSKEEGLSLFELIRNYMEYGAQGIEQTAAAKLQTETADYTRAAYRQKMQEMRRKNPLFYPLWRLWNIVTLRYWAHWYLERDLDVLPSQMMNREEVVNWCQPLPESEWQPMSDELQEANQRVRALYAAGYQWESEEVRSVLQDYVRVS
ncbi:hypothetical protein VR7878_01162 [Vibrio ruber DSM 16370]|uniref:Uncharacterized protein n=1 Tax=Vibrio ruber (strain DSM 16370 / JCM 11486 / BCRC 17186 / CECT 7878 / LMG 23124 / VR1) TaxID=1123498 RepID=A0A1R4LG73_VIBR1|nr:hypothetical protein VR7878_01162 [Vibrio ruber DSM 16370]